MLHKVESMMIILSSAYIASFGTPYGGVIYMLLFSSLIDTCNNNFGTNCGSS